MSEQAVSRRIGMTALLAIAALSLFPLESAAKAMPATPGGSFPTLLDDVTSNTTGISNGLCATPSPVTSFSTTSPQVWLYFDVNGASVGDTAQMQFYRPDGTLYTTFNSSVSSITTSTGYQCFSYVMNLAGTAAASYPGTWTIKTYWDQTNLLFTLNFTVTAAASTPVLALSTTQLNFSTAVGVNPAAQTFLVQNTGVGSMIWTGTVSTSSGGNWLALSPAAAGSVTTSSTVTVSVNSSGLSTGTYQGTITISAPAASGSPQTVAVTLNVGTPPDQNLNYSLSSTGVCSSSFYIAQATLAPGQVSGNYSLIVAVSQGLLAGGFNLGGAFGPNGTYPGFGQFKTPTNLAASPVAITINAQPASSGPLRLAVTVNQVTANGNVLVYQTNGVPPLNFLTPTLNPATYYTVVVSSTAGEPSSTFQMSMASQLGGVPGAGGFEGGVVVGGYLTPGVVGYGGFCVPVTQTINVVQQGQASGYTAGAVNVVMTDSSGKVYPAVGSPLPALTLNMSANPTSVTSGGTVTYTLTTSNTGGASAQNVAVADTLPSGFTFASCNTTAGSCTHSGNSVAASLGTLAAGASATVTIAAVAASVSSSTNTTNSASVTTSSQQSTTSSNQASANVTVTPVVAAGFAIKSVSNSSPMPLTPLYLTTSGVNTSSAVTVQFTNSSGYSVSLPALRVASDGTVAVAVPIYANTSAQTSAASLSVVIKQGSQTSAPVTINVQDLPSVASYGVKPGDITRAFLNYHQQQYSRLLNQMQAYSGLPNNKVNSSNTQKNLISLRNGAILARNDADRVAATPSTVIYGGSSGGTAINYTSQSLDMSDRVLAMYLTQMVPIYTQAAIAMQNQREQPLIRIHRADARPRPGHSLATQSKKVDGRRDPDAVNLSSMKNILAFITGANAGAAIADSMQSDDSSKFDIGLSVVAGAAGIAGLSPNPTVQMFAAGLGLVCSTIAVAEDAYNIGSDIAGVMNAMNGNDPAALAAAQTKLNGAAFKGALDLTQTFLNVLSLETGGVSGVITNYFGLEGKILSEAQALQNDVGIASASLIATGAQVAADAGFIDLKTTAANLGSEFPTPFNSSTQGFGVVEGQANVNNNAGSGFAGLTGVVLNSTSNLDSFSIQADPTGAYGMFIPLGDPRFNYSGAEIEIVDPISDEDLTTVRVNLSTLTSKTAVQLPAVSASCNDSDASDPDEDDPDCDGVAPQSVKPRPSQPVRPSPRFLGPRLLGPKLVEQLRRVSDIFNSQLPLFIRPDVGAPAY